MHDQGDQRVNQAREDRAEEDTEVAAGNRTNQRGNERERASEEHGALAAGCEEVEQRADARAEQRRRLAHVRASAIEVDQHRNQQRRCHDRQHLLERVDEILFNGRLVIDVVNQFHSNTPPFA